MSTFVLKRKTFSEDGTGKKVALGTIGTLGAAGLAFAGAKSGLAGKSLQNSANMLQGRVGNMMHNGGMNLMKNAQEGLAKNSAAPKALLN
jgi:hypothetical protein